MNRRLRIAISMLAPFVSTVASGAEIDVTLAPLTQTVKRGEGPRFEVTVKAISNGQRVMKFADRGDLRDNYAELVVTRDGGSVDVPRIISDPGPTSAGDYTELIPGQKMTFGHDGMPYILAKLRSGSYSAVVKLRADWGSVPVMSNRVSFTVGP